MTSLFQLPEILMGFIRSLQMIMGGGGSSSCACIHKDKERKEKKMKKKIYFHLLMMMKRLANFTDVKSFSCSAHSFVICKQK